MLGPFLSRPKLNRSSAKLSVDLSGATTFRRSCNTNLIYAGAPPMNSAAWAGRLKPNRQSSKWMLLRVICGHEQDCAADCSHATPSQQFERHHGDGCITMTLDVCLDQALRSWILSFGAAAVVTAPATLRASIADDVELVDLPERCVVRGELQLHALGKVCLLHLFVHDRPRPDARRSLARPGNRPA